jgi:hypothetical protein
VAKGSHSTFGGWEPRVCEGCDERIVLSGPKAQGVVFRFNVEREQGRARHADCSWRTKR